MDHQQFEIVYEVIHLAMTPQKDKRFTCARMAYFQKSMNIIYKIINI